MTKFKARELKPEILHQNPLSTKSTPTSKALMAVVREFKFHSQIRQQQREEFMKHLKEKESHL
jgi:hypothetical protein